MKYFSVVLSLLVCFITSSQAQIAPQSSPYFQNGPFTVVMESELSTNPDLYIYRPQQGTGPFPVFIFQPGANPLFGSAAIDYSSYEIYLQHLASYGYIVIAIDDATAGFPSGGAFTEAYNWYLQKLNDPNHWMSQIADQNNVIVGGHSLGGVKASDFLQNNKNNIQGIVYFASFPSQGFIGIAAHNIDDYQGKVLSIAGQEDSQSTPADCYEGYESFEQSACRYWVLLDGVAHGGFGDYVNPGQPVGTSGRQSVTASIRHYLVSFMEYSFKGDSVAGDYLNRFDFQINNTREFETNCIYLLGEKQACVGDTMVYQVGYSSGNAYCWLVDNGTAISSGPSSLRVLWDTVGAGSVSVRECFRSDYNGLRLVNVEGIPSSDFTFTSNDGAFAFQSEGLPNIIYSWDFGDNTFNTGPNPFHQYTDTGSYIVSLTATGNICSSNKKDTLISDLCPIANFTFSVVNGQVLLENESRFYNRLIWDFGNGDTSSLINPLPILQEDSTYLFSLTAFNNFCSDTFFQSVSIGACPDADFEYIGNGLDFNFNNLSADNQSNIWRIDNQTVSTDSNLNFTFADSGQYVITLVVYSASNCIDSLSKIIQVNLIDDSLTTQINEITFKNWIIYPNPFDDILKVTVTINAEYQILDITGKMLDNGILKEGNNSLSLEFLTKGFYQLMLSSSKETQVLRLMKH